MNERCLIINADDFGMCYSTNQAIRTLLLEGSITSASLMMTCPWVTEAVSFLKQHPSMDVGIHFTHTSEWKHYKWGPLHTNLKTLVDKYGNFPAETETVIARADHDELREEAIAQMELALRMGVDPTNIDNHMGSMHHVMDILLELCERYQLPLRYSKNVNPLLVSKYRIGPNHEDIVHKAEKKGIVLLDYIEMLPFFPQDGAEPGYEFTKEVAIKYIQELKAGVTELVLHPSLDTDELKAITNTWKVRRFEFDVFRDSEIQALLKKEDVRLVHWRDLRDLQRT